MQLPGVLHTNIALAVAALEVDAAMWSRPAWRGAAAALLRRRIASATRRSLRAELEALYEEHNPSKLADVDALAAKYGEAKLLAMARKKYGLPPPSAAPPPDGAGEPPPVKVRDLRITPASCGRDDFREIRGGEIVTVMLGRHHRGRPAADERRDRAR